MSRENTSSVDMASGKKMAYLASQEKVTIKSQFQAKGESGDVVEKQVVNARKLANLADAKAKAKRKSKLAKASRKKNKK